MEKMTKADLLEERGKFVNERAELLNKSKEEKRALTDKELSRAQECATSIQCIDAKLDEIRAQEREKNQAQPKPNKRQANLLDAVRAQLTGKMTDEVRTLLKQGEEIHTRSGVGESAGFLVPFETRADLTATANGDKLIDTDLKKVLDPIAKRLILVQAGANYLTGLVGNIEIPSYSGTTADWAEENAEAKDGAGTFSNVKMSPKRLTTTVKVSKQLILQDSVSAYEMLLRTIRQAISQKLEATILGAEAGSSSKPAGLFNGTISDKGSISFARLVNLEASAEDFGLLSENLKYITSPQGKALLRQTLKDKTTGAGAFLSDGKTLNSLPLLVSSFVPKNLNTSENGLLLGDFSNLIIGQWGAMDLVVDPYTGKNKALVEITINAYFDAINQREGSILKASFKA